MTKWWVSWWHHDESHGGFEIHSPWWVSGQDMEDRVSICAAIRARDEDHVREIIASCYDAPEKVENLDYRFIEEREASWSPFNSRFCKADWMKWEE